MNDRTLKKLIKEFQEHNMDVFPIIYDGFKKLIFLYSYRIGDEDAAQELTLFFIELLYELNTDRFNSDNSNEINKYIAVCLRNKYIEISKKNSRNRDMLTELCDNYFICENSSYSDFETLEMLKNLSEKQRYVIICKYIYMYSDAEISRILKISRQAVNRLKNRALEELRGVLKA